MFQAHNSHFRQLAWCKFKVLNILLQAPVVCFFYPPFPAQTSFSFETWSHSMFWIIFPPSHSPSEPSHLSSPGGVGERSPVFSMSQGFPSLLLEVVFKLAEDQQDISSSFSVLGGPLIVIVLNSFQLLPASKIPIVPFKSLLQLHQLLVLHVSLLRYTEPIFISFLSLCCYKNCSLQNKKKSKV